MMPEKYLKTVFDLNKFHAGQAIRITSEHTSTVGFIAEATEDKLKVEAYVSEDNVLLSCWVGIDDAMDMNLKIEVL